MQSDEYEEKLNALEQTISKLEAQKTDAEFSSGIYLFNKNWFEKYGLIIAWIIIILALGFYKPAQMFSWNSYSSMFGSNAMVVVLTLALIIPLTTGDFDLSVAATMGLSSMIIAVLNVNFGFNIFSAIAIALACGVFVGLVNAFFIIYFGVFSLIVTLGTGYFIAGIILWISNSGTIAGVSMTLVKGVILNRFLGVPLGFYYAMGLTIFIWYVFQHTALGKRMLFVGRGRDIARLSGIKIVKLRTLALVSSSTIAAFAGVIYTGMRGAADPSSALAFLLPAFAAAFLGSTAIYPGRFNALGSLVAVYFLSTGIMGLNFLGVDSFVQNLFYGGGLVLAVAISQLIRGRPSMD